MKSAQFKQEFSHKSKKYIVATVSIKDTDKEVFEKSMKELATKMLILGHNDYLEECHKIFDIMFADYMGGIS